MSKVYEALRQMERENNNDSQSAPLMSTARPEFLREVLDETSELATAKEITLQISERSRLVAFTTPNTLGAEKFRALATRLENSRSQQAIKSLQITSSIGSEGKTVVAANLAVTFAKYSRSRVLLLEGDLHRPSLASLFGLAGLPNLSQWWSEGEQDLPNYLCRVKDLPLWFLSAGEGHQDPSALLRSPRFIEAFGRLCGLFSWIIVDSTPMHPVADANLWARLVDGTLLVVREGVASVAALSAGIQSLDNLNLIGIVLNEASEGSRTGYGDGYYGTGPKNGRKPKGI